MRDYEPGCESKTMRAAAQMCVAASATAMLAMVLAPLRRDSAAVVYAEAAQVTWRQQIAPVVYKNCTSCHHDGGSGPFALMTYEDAKRRGGLVKAGPENRYLDPWVAEPRAGPVARGRRVTAGEIAPVEARDEGGIPEAGGSAPPAPAERDDC